MTNKTFELMQAIAPWLERLSVDPNARIGIDLFAGALTWSDERPDMEALIEGEMTISCLRGLLRYRTLLILGRPAEKFFPNWEEGKRLFPHWPGFLPERRDPKWGEQYLALEAAGIGSLEKLDERFERISGARVNGPATAPQLANRQSEII